MVYTLTHGGYAVRKHAQQETKKMICTLGGSEIALALIQQFRILLKDQKASVIQTHPYRTTCSHLPPFSLQLVDEESIEDNAEVSHKYIKPKVLYEALSTLAIIPHAEPSESQLIALEILQDAHHPCIGL